LHHLKWSRAELVLLSNVGLEKLDTLVGELNLELLA
jgi:hypothetical protein